MRVCDAVRYEGELFVIAKIVLGEIGDVDERGEGVLRLAPVADLEPVSASSRHVQGLRDVPLNALQAVV